MLGDEFYELTREGKGKEPYYIGLKDKRPLFWLGTVPKGGKRQLPESSTNWLSSIWGSLHDGRETRWCSKVSCGLDTVQLRQVFPHNSE